MTPSATERARARAIAKELAGIGFVLPGTLSERYLRCRSVGVSAIPRPSPRLVALTKATRPAKR